MNSFQAGIARQLAATTPLAPEKAATIITHCAYMMEHRGYLEDFEQALLVRVARFPPVPPPYSSLVASHVHS